MFNLISILSYMLTARLANALLNLAYNLEIFITQHLQCSNIYSGRFYSFFSASDRRKIIVIRITKLSHMRGNNYKLRFVFSPVRWLTSQTCLKFPNEMWDCVSGMRWGPNKFYLIGETSSFIRKENPDLKGFYLKFGKLASISFDGVSNANEVPM